MSATPQAYADADFANQLSNRRSTSRRATLLYGAVVMWPSRQQRTVALSTAEAGTQSLLDLGRDVVWLRRLLADLGTPLMYPTPTLEDSKSAIKWAAASASWSKTRHIDTAFHKLREWQDDGVIKVEYCPTTQMLAHCFTKALPPEAHAKFKMAMLGELYKISMMHFINIRQRRPQRRPQALLRQRAVLNCDGQRAHDAAAGVAATLTPHVATLFR